MHVVLVVPGGVDRSGVDRVIPVLLELIERLAVRHRVTVLALGQEPLDATYDLLGARVVNVRLPRATNRPAAGLGLLDLVRRAVAAVPRDPPPDVVHGFWASVSGMIAVAAGKRLGVPVVVTAAGGELVNRPDLDYGGARRAGGRLIARAAYRGADLVTVGSGWMADHVRAEGQRVDAVVPLGVDCARFSPGPPGSAIPGRIVSVAGLNRIKDPFLLVDALVHVRDAIPTASLELVGLDTLDGAVRRHATDRGLGTDSVILSGEVPSAAVPAHLRRAELHTLASFHDAAPVAVLEAAACGVPTVGTAVGHVTDLAALTPPAAWAIAGRSPENLAAAMVALLGDGERRAAMGAAARSWALAHRAETTTARFEAIYSRLAADRRTR